MTKHAFVHFETDTGIPRAEWDEFCQANEIERAPDETPANVWYLGGQHGVQCIYGTRSRPGEVEEKASEVMFLSNWGGPKLEGLATLAKAFWCRFGGALYAETEVRKLICK